MKEKQEYTVEYGFLSTMCLENFGYTVEGKSIHYGSTLNIQANKSGKS